MQQRRSDGPVGAHALDVLVVVLGRALKVAHLGVDVGDGAVRVRVALKTKGVKVSARSQQVPCMAHRLPVLDALAKHRDPARAHGGGGAGGSELTKQLTEGH